DDDLLYPAGAAEKLEIIEATRSNVVSNPIELLRTDGKPIRLITTPETNDFVSAVLLADRLLQVTSHLFRKNCLDATDWDERLPYAQDVDWMLRLCSKEEPKWAKGNRVCGAWRRHTAARTTTAAGLHQANVIAAESTLRLTAVLNDTNRLTQERRMAAAS